MAGRRSDSSNDGDNGYPSYNAGPRFLQLWPNVYSLVGDSDTAGNPLPWLP
jgi:hypothetical protein